MEAIVLGQKLHLQTEELTQLQQKSQADITSAEMLQQAHADLVCVVYCMFVKCMHLYIVHMYHVYFCKLTHGSCHVMHLLNYRAL